MNADWEQPNQEAGAETFEATGDEQEAILSRMAPNDRAHYTSLMTKYREGATQQRHEDKLRKVGLIVAKTETGTPNVERRTLNAEGGSGQMVVPSYASSAAELAQILDTYFRERIFIEISPTLVGQWRKGLRVGEVFIDGKKVIPPSLPKNKSGNRFETRPCIEWVEKWIVPQKGVDSSKLIVDGRPGTAMDFDRIKQEHAIWQMQREKDLSDGKFKSVEVFNTRLIALRTSVMNAIKEVEKMLKKDETPEATADMLRAMIIKAFLEAKEPEGLATDEHR